MEICSSFDFARSTEEIVLVFVPVIGVMCGVATSNDCSTADVGKCVALISVYGQSAVVPWYSKAVVKDICS